MGCVCVRSGRELGVERELSERGAAGGSGGGRRVRILNYLKDLKVDRCKMCSCGGSK